MSFVRVLRGAIGVGRDWLTDVEQKLTKARAILVIVTPISIERPWLWFEIGATWLKGRNGDCRIYPLCAPEIELAELPPPLDRLQALSIGKAADLRILFQALIEQFGFGKISTLRATNISKRIPKYKDVKIVDVDLSGKSFYSGKFDGYTDQELMEVLDTELLLPDAEKYRQFTTLYRGREDIVPNGKLVHFRKVDRDLELPPGTSRRLLGKVAARYGLVPIMETDNVVRYRVKESR